MPTWSMLECQDASSPLMEEMIEFHDLAMYILISIISSVATVIIGVILNPNMDLNLLEGQEIESIWTVIPALILLVLGFPSLSLLYMIDEYSSCALTLKVTGHQWYWTYDWDDAHGQQEEFEHPGAYILPEASNRLLETSAPLYLPCLVQTRMLVTSADVLHSWAVPSLGVKVDACPGRINQISFMSKRPGHFFGQCSEICGALHSFMPIHLFFSALTVNKK